MVNLFIVISSAFVTTDNIANESPILVNGVHSKCNSSSQINVTICGTVTVKMLYSQRLFTFHYALVVSAYLCYLRCNATNKCLMEEYAVLF